MSPMIVPIPAMYYSISGDIYAFLNVVKQNQFKIRNKEISVFYKLLDKAHNGNNIEFFNWVKRLENLAISIHTKNGYISNIDDSFSLIYQLHDRYNLSLPLLCENFCELEVKMIELLKEDLIDLGFDGNLSQIK